MGNKTPPLVIPVVIDSSGVNRGLNNVNNRLRQGVSGGAASPGGFGSAGAAAAAGLAAGAAVGAFSGGNGGGSFAAAVSVTPRARGLLPLMGQASGRFAGGGMSPRYKQLLGNAQSAFQLYGDLTPEQSRANVDELYRQRSARRALQAHEIARRNKRFGIAFQKNNPLNQDFSGFGEDIGKGLGMVKRATALALAGGVAAYGAYANLGQRISNIDNLVGSRNYGKMRQAQLRAFDQGPQASALQNFMIGGMNAAGQGRATMFEKDAAAFQKGFGDLMRAGGLGYEILRRDPVMALELWLAATPMGRLFGLDFKEMLKTEVQYLNWKAAQK